MFADLIQKAIKSKENSDKQFRHFTFVLDGNKIISVGVNDANKTHPLAKKHGYLYACQHSELNAIVRLKKKPEILKKCIMVNVRLNKFDKVRLSRPCQHCQQLIKVFGVKKVYYSNENGLFEEYVYKI